MELITRVKFGELGVEFGVESEPHRKHGRMETIMI